MWGDIFLFLRWEEVNECSSFQDGDKRKVMLYGKVKPDLEFDSGVDAAQWLYKYYKKVSKEKIDNKDV